MAHAGGRPKIDDSLVLATIELIGDGLSIRKACAQTGIGTRTFTEKILLPEFSQHYARAMEKRADAIFDEIISISDGLEPVEYVDEELTEKQFRDKAYADVQRDRLRVDARKWVVSKMLPKKYGEKIQQELSTPEGIQIIYTVVGNK